MNHFENTLQIYLDSAVLNMSKIWSKSGEQGSTWMKGTAKIGGHANFRIVFEGVRGTGYRGDIAIDDITFRNCKPGKSCR